MNAKILSIPVQVCPHCGCWGSISATARSHTVTNSRTGLKTRYNCQCKRCGGIVVVREVPPKP